MNPEGVGSFNESSLPEDEYHKNSDFNTSSLRGGSSGEFTEYFFSKAAFKEKLVAPIDKLYALDDKFIEYASKYCSLLRSFSSELERLKDKYEKSTSKFSDVYTINECYESFSDILKCQSALFAQQANDISTNCFGSDMKKGLSQQKAELAKLNSEVDQADRAHMETISNIRSKRKACASLMQDCEKIEDKRPHQKGLTKETVRYENHKNAAARKLDESNDEYVKACSESNKERLTFELQLQDALFKYQHVAADRVYLVQTNCRKFLDCHEKFCERFANTSARFKTCAEKIDVQTEVNKFVAFNVKNSKQELEPEMIIFDLPGVRDDDSRKDETKMYTIRQLRKQICIRKIISLQKQEEKAIKCVELARTVLSKAMQDTQMKEKFTDEKKSKQELINLLNEVDIIQISIQNLVNDYFALNRSNSPRDEPQHPLASYLTSIKEPTGKGVQYMAVKPPLDYYYDHQRQNDIMKLPHVIQEEIDFSKGSDAATIARHTGTSVEEPGRADNTDWTGPSGSTAREELDDDFDQHWKAKVKFTFNPQELYPDLEDASYMLKVVQDQVITILENLADDWCLAEDAAGNQGHVPSGFIEALDS